MTYGKDTFKFEIIDKIAVISTEKNGWTKELNLVSFNDAPPKYDLRTWDPDHIKMGKGVTLSKEEIKKLKDAMDEIGL